MLTPEKKLHVAPPDYRSLKYIDNKSHRNAMNLFILGAKPYGNLSLIQIPNQKQKKKQKKPLTTKIVPD